MIDRRQFMLGSGVLAASTLGLAGYAVGIEPALTPAVRSYDITPKAWPPALTLKIGVISDIHACMPWMSAERVHGIALQMNALAPDIIVLLGDFSAGHRFVTGPVMPAEWGEALAVLRAPLGVHAILGNHDWWHGPVPGMAGGPAEVRQALRQRGITVLENAALPLSKDGEVFWLAGLADQMARRVKRGWTEGADDLGGTLAQVSENDAVVLLAHEPFIFRHVPKHVALTLCGHTHGGQVNLPLIGAPLTPTRRYRYGHIVENGRHLVVSGGLGESGLPIRLGVPPELVLVNLTGTALTA